MREIIDRLKRNHSLQPDEYGRLLDCRDKETLDYLHLQARDTALSVFGNKIYLRGLIEIGNACRNDCYYCGIRKSNASVNRYRLDETNILQACRQGYELGFRTFVLQGGEDGNDSFIEAIVSILRKTYPDCAITLSLGEKTRQTYERWFRAGANRYLLRHETHNASHYSQLHPPSLSIDKRLRCLSDLKEIGYQTGTGIMVGSPFQTRDHLVEDILFIKQFEPEMIGLGPFIPHRDTCFANHPAGSVRQTLILLSIFRLMFPQALIPSTTALNTLDPEGRAKGILAGANVLMPNLTPTAVRSNYEIYNNKSHLGAEAAEGLAMLREQMQVLHCRLL